MNVGYDADLVARLVEEGKRIGKAPWSCCGLSEMEACKRLGYIMNNHAIHQESFEETFARRKQEQIKKARNMLWDIQVAITPGAAFGWPEGYVRAAVCGEPEDVIEGITRLAGFAREYQGRGR